MVKELMHDPIFLAGKSEIATKEDLQVAQTTSFNVSVRDNVAIYGGEVASDSNEKNSSFAAVHDGGLDADVEKLWAICKKKRA
jgi:hypothetical protein